MFGKRTRSRRISTAWARERLMEANRDPEHRAMVADSQSFDTVVGAIMTRYLRSMGIAGGVEPLTYRQARRTVSWSYQLTRYARFTQTRPSLWRALRRHRAWRRHLLQAVRNDLQNNAFAGEDAWLNRSPLVLERLEHLRQAQVGALRAELEDLMAPLTRREQLCLACSVAVFCRTTADARNQGAHFVLADVLGARALAPLRPIAE